MPIEIVIDAIYISDEWGEIVSWTEVEWIEDPTVAVSIFSAIRMYYEQGSYALRKSIKREGDIPYTLVENPTIQTLPEIGVDYDGQWVLMEELGQGRYRVLWASPCRDRLDVVDRLPLSTKPLRFEYIKDQWKGIE